jgi:hypothetical protein
VLLPEFVEVFLAVIESVSLGGAVEDAEVSWDFPSAA